MALDNELLDRSDKPQFARLWNANTRTDLLAEMYGKASTTISQWARQDGLRPRNVLGRIISIHKRDFSKMWNDGMPVEAIAGRLKCSESNVMRLVEFFDLIHRPESKPDQIGETIPLARDVPGASFWTRQRDARVRGTGGRYRDIAALAVKLKVPSTKIQARWHVLKVAG